jgi:phosphoribosylaminoimidazole-succinocarboxamide synthase
MTLPSIIYEGSVKNVRGEEGQSPYIFEFSDRYSIFDWGQMPDVLNGKGESLAFMAWFFFDFLGKPENWQHWQSPKELADEGVLRGLRESGVKHHALGLVDHDMKPMPLAREFLSPARCLAVEPVDVIDPASRIEDGKLVWDYAAYLKRPENTLVPLEVIFRFGVPDGSSLLQRTGNAEYCKTLGLPKAPKTGDTFDIPLVEYSTKLETSDRYLSYAEAQGIAGLTNEEFRALGVLTRLIALRLKDVFETVGIELWDGKFEFAFGKKDRNGNRALMLVDSIGPDELRLIKGGAHLSKEALRGFYRPTAWYAGLEEAKKLARERGEKDWKRICKDELKLIPPILAPGVKQRAEMVYKSIAKALSRQFCGNALFPDAWELDEVVKSATVKKEKVA